MMIQYGEDWDEDDGEDVDENNDGDDDEDDDGEGEGDGNDEKLESSQQKPNWLEGQTDCCILVSPVSPKPMPSGAVQNAE